MKRLADRVTNEQADQAERDFNALDWQPFGPDYTTYDWDWLWNMRWAHDLRLIGGPNDGYPRRHRKD